MNPSKVTDAFGCPMGKLDQDRKITSSNISFFHKLSHETKLGRIETEANDRGYLIGLTLKGGHDRRIFKGARSTRYLFEENSVYVRKFDEDYKADAQGAFEFALLEISHDGLQTIAGGADRTGNTTLKNEVAKSDPILGGLVRALFSIREGAFSVSNLLVDQLSAAIGVHLLNSYGDRSAAPPALRQFLTPVQENLAKDYLANMPAALRSTDHIAAACGLSRVAFIRAFRETTGMTPHQWLWKHRIDKARSLLSKSPMNLEDIAAACGFVDLREFSRTFTEATGVTPNTFRASTQL